MLKFLTHSLFLACIITLVIVIINEPRITKYQSVLLDEHLFLEGQRIYYNDFNSDGISEKVMMGYNTQSGIPFVMISDIHNKFICQWDFIDDWIDRADALFGDCDNNGFDEIYAFTKVGDTIFINGYEPFTDSITTFKKQVDIASKYVDENDFDIYVGQVKDLDNDGFKEVVFIINSGYSILPRNVYIYYPKFNSISKSPTSGAQIPVSPEIVDIDNDGDMEILLSSYAPGNMGKSNLPYNDSSSWLMILDHHNQFLFEPVENPNRISSVSMVPKVDETGSMLIVNTHSGNSVTTGSPMISVFSLSGDQILTKKYSELGVEAPVGNFFYLRNKNEINAFLIDRGGKIYQINNDLSLRKTDKLMDDIRGYIKNPFVGENNILFWSRNRQSIYLFKKDFKHPIKFEIINNGGKLTYSEAFLSDGTPAYSIQVGRNWHLFTYNINPLYYLRFPIYLLITIIIFLLISFVKKVQRDQLIKKHNNERKVLNLQLTTMKNQLNPHFTLNILNSIGGLSIKKQDEADYYFGKYSKLIRQTLLGADKISVTLAEELEFIRNYLDLEQFRYGDRFKYVINCKNEDTLNKHIPRMLIHSFVENSVKHGLKHLKKDGLLTIEIKEEGNVVLIDISDNGIGREAARRMHTVGTGKGLEIINQMVSIYNQLKNTKINYTIEDLVNEQGAVAGTIVKVTFPKN